jgi:hypothetical protein
MTAHAPLSRAADLPSTRPGDAPDSAPVTEPAAPRPRRARWLDWLPDVAAFAGALLCAVLAALLAGALGGCGGGVGTEGTGGFSATSSATGPITGFGSIIVNGVHYDERSAAIDDDDAQSQPATKLALGMMVQVTGGAVTTDASGRQVATATQVRVNRALVGPVTARNTAAGTLTVLGRTVQTDSGTVLDSAFIGGLAGVAIGQVVEVYGSYNPSSSTLQATRIGLAAASSAYGVRGTVTAVDAANRTFVIDGQTCSSAGLADASALQVGTVVKVDLQSSPDNQGRWVAGSQRAGQPSGGNADRDGVKLQGLIAAVSSATRLVIEGTVVDLSTAKLSGVPKVGVSATVSGAMRSGVLVATEVQVSSSGGNSGRSFELEGKPSAVDLLARRLVLRGTVVNLGRADLVVKGGTLAQLSTSLKISIVGVLSADGTVVDATTVQIEN